MLATPIEIYMVIFMKSLRNYVRWSVLLAIAMGVLTAFWYGFMPELRGAYISPRKIYRIEYYDASPLQQLWFYKMKIPSFVRLYRIEPETLLGESKVVDMWLNGELYWYLEPPINSVRVGIDVVFRNIPPECKDCPPLTNRQIMGLDAPQ